MADPEQEQTRLAALYAGMDDGQLEDLAEDRASLTEVARASLENELARRGITLGSDDAPAGAVDYRELKVVRTFSGSGEALLAKGFLESGGIECILSDENNALQDLEGLGSAREIRLQVKPEDAEAAVEVLNQLFRTDSDGQADSEAQDRNENSQEE